MLRQKGKRQKPTETRGRINVGLPVLKRPPEVKNRRTFGHWEHDTVVSGRGESKACVATFLERKSRFYLALPITDHTTTSIEGVIYAVYGVPMYFADPYASWKRGSNENANGFLREFFQKGTDFARVTRDEIAGALAKINGRPRKCLNWKTANEAFTEEVLRLI